MEKKNTMLLTVIAVATLLVAVVGATFAYFTATSKQSATSVKVVTPGKQSASMNGGEPIVLNIAPSDMENEAGKYGAKTASNNSSAVVSFTPSTATEGSLGTAQKFCYVAKLKYDASAFTYSEGHLKGSGSEHGAAAQVTLTVNKDGYKTEADSAVFTEEDITNTQAENYIPTTGNVLTGTAKEAIHIIEATSTGSGVQTAKTDTWTIKLSFHNRNYDQTQNVSKTATASITFDQVNCTTGEIISTIE